MPRIDRKVRKDIPKSSALWPAPATAELCRSAVACASIKQLISARELIRSTPPAPGENPFARFILFDINIELKKRFRGKLAGGLSQPEVEQWTEVLEDRQFVAWHVARTPLKRGATVMPTGRTAPEGEQL